MISWRSRLILVSCIFLAAGWVAIDAAKATWHAYGQIQGSPITISLRQMDTPTFDPDVQAIVGRQIFGSPEVPEVQTTPAPEPTSLDLTLRGVVLTDRQAFSVAYISRSGRPAKGFFPGERVTDRTTVLEVRENVVLLNVDGKIETLGFPDPGSRNQANRVRANIMAATGQTSVPAAGSTPDQAIEFWRQRIAANPQGVLNQLGLEATDNGYVIGTKAHSGVRLAGFRPGDLVARVNGSEVGDIETDRRLYDEIAASGRARVELVRNGKPIVLTFPLR